MSDSDFLSKLISDYPQFSFKSGKKFKFRPKKTIFYVSKSPNFKPLLLHELSHALLGHFSFETSLERLQIERDAWQKTSELCALYSIPFSEDFFAEELDSYRDWLHKKTLCRVCGLSCIELSSTSLYCPKCQKTYSKISNPSKHHS